MARTPVVDDMRLPTIVVTKKWGKQKKKKSRKREEFITVYTRAENGVELNMKKKKSLFPAH